MAADMIPESFRKAARDRLEYEPERDVFSPGRAATRAELATVAYRLCRMNGLACVREYGDMRSTHWAYGAMHNAVVYRWLSGGPDGLLRPDDPVSRETAERVLTDIAGFASGSAPRRDYPVRP